MNAQPEIPKTPTLPATLLPPPSPSWRSAWVRDIEPCPDPVDGAQLLDDLARLVRRHVVLPNAAAETLALWVLHTYAFELRDVSAYLGIESPEKRCGKTTLLGVLSELVSRPVIAANISSPAFFRVIEELRPTLLIDEADTLLRGNDELRGILNAGYSRKTAFVVRVASQSAEGRDSSNAPASRDSETAPRLVRFSCWCPKAIAAIGRLPETLADRCIVIRMQRKSAEEVCERLRDLEAAELRRRCARFVRDHAARIAAIRPQAPPELNDRAADIIEELNRYADRPWHELTRSRPLDGRILARLLSPYGIGPRSLRIGELRGKGYRRADFTDAFQRYIPRSELEDLEDENHNHAVLEARKKAEAEAQALAAAQAASQTDSAAAGDRPTEQPPMNANER